MPTRRRFLASVAAAGLAPRLPAADVPPFDLDELAVADLTARFSARQLVDRYLARIAAIDRGGPTLRSVIETNPDAADIADALDRAAKRGPLHGVPVLVKDNIDTADRMGTTAGSLALVGAKPAKDAALVTRLRDAGAVLLGKANLSEWANFRSGTMAGWSARGGQTKNPYVLSASPSGSSSGSAVAVAASLCAVSVGTETDGSIVSPATACGVVGVKPTVGLVSRAGVVPISRTQDTAGPMARTVRDAALLLTVLADDADHATDYATALDPNGLKGARLGVVGDESAAGFTAAVAVLEKAGATAVPVRDPDDGKYRPAEMTVMLYEFKAGLNEYLAGLGPTAPVKTLADVIAFNEANADREELKRFGQKLMLRAEACGPLTDEKYLAALADCRTRTRADGIDAVLAAHKLDALVAAAPHGCSVAAVAGYPYVTVPAGVVRGLPVGLGFFGPAWSEPTLLRLAFAFEQSARRRQPPRFLDARPE